MSCETCKEHKEVAPVPYIVHESAMARNERNMKRIVLLLVAALIGWFLSICAFLYVWQLYDYSGTEIGDRNTATFDGAERND